MGKVVSVLELFYEKGDEISRKYETSEESFDTMITKDLAKEYNCSHNTMLILLGVLGYHYPSWARIQVDRKLASIEKAKNNRNRSNGTV